MLDKERSKIFTSAQVICLIIFLTSSLMVNSADIIQQKNKKIFRVTKVEVSITENPLTISCPKTIKFAGKITANSKGTVEYQWISNSTSKSLPKSLYFPAAGTKEVKTSWTIGEPGKVYKDYWKAIAILSPNRMISNKAMFTVNCKAMMVTPPVYEIKGKVHKEMPGNLLEGHLVIVILKQEGRVKGRVTLELDETSSANYRFSRFLGPGTYTVTVEKGPNNQEHYTSPTDVCFDGTNPVRHTVTLDATNRSAADCDFLIIHHVLWGSPGSDLCW